MIGFVKSAAGNFLSGGGVGVGVGGEDGSEGSERGSAMGPPSTPRDGESSDNFEDEEEDGAGKQTIKGKGRGILDMEGNDGSGMGLVRGSSGGSGVHYVRGRNNTLRSGSSPATTTMPDVYISNNNNHTDSGRNNPDHGLPAPIATTPTHPMTSTSTTSRTRSSGGSGGGGGNDTARRKRRARGTKSKPGTRTNSNNSTRPTSAESVTRPRSVPTPTTIHNPHHHRHNSRRHGGRRNGLDSVPSSSDDEEMRTTTDGDTDRGVDDEEGGQTGEEAEEDEDEDDETEDDDINDDSSDEMEARMLANVQRIDGGEREGRMSITAPAEVIGGAGMVPRSTSTNNLASAAAGAATGTSPSSSVGMVDGGHSLPASSTDNDVSLFDRDRSSPNKSRYCDDYPDVPAPGGKDIDEASKNLIRQAQVTTMPSSSSSASTSTAGLKRRSAEFVTPRRRETITAKDWEERMRDRTDGKIRKRDGSGDEARDASRHRDGEDEEVDADPDGMSTSGDGDAEIDHPHHHSPRHSLDSPHRRHQPSSPALPLSSSAPIPQTPQNAFHHPRFPVSGIDFAAAAPSNSKIPHAQPSPWPFDAQTTGAPLSPQIGRSLQLDLAALASTTAGGSGTAAIPQSTSASITTGADGLVWQDGIAVGGPYSQGSERGGRRISLSYAQAASSPTQQQQPLPIGITQGSPVRPTHTQLRSIGSAGGLLAGSPVFSSSSLLTTTAGAPGAGTGVGGSQKIPPSHLPHEILLTILRMVSSSPSSLRSAILVCKSWCQCGVELLWHKPSFGSPVAVQSLFNLLYVVQITAQSPAYQDRYGQSSLLRLAAKASLPEKASKSRGKDKDRDRAAIAPNTAIVSAPMSVDDETAGSGSDVRSGSGSGHEQPEAPSTPKPPQALTSTTIGPGGAAVIIRNPKDFASPTFPYPLFIKRLNFSAFGSKITDMVLVRLAPCVRLERLTLSGCKDIGDQSLTLLLKCLRNLVALDLSDCPKVSDPSIKTAGKYCRRLQGLNLSSCKNVGDKGVSEVAKGCRDLRRIKLRELPELTDAPLILLSRYCPYLLEIDIVSCVKITDKTMWQLWRSSTHIRELHLANCALLGEAGFPNKEFIAEGGGRHSLHHGNLNDDSATEGGSKSGEDDSDEDSEKSKDEEEDTSISERLGGSEHDHLLLTRHPNSKTPQGPAQAATPFALTEKPYPPTFDHIRFLDLSQLTLLTDVAIDGIVTHMPRIRNLILAKCNRLTDEAIISVGKLGKHLHYLHLGHVAGLHDAAVVKLARSCTRLRYIDLACCPLLTDLSVSELATNLPRLKRVGLVRVSNLTDQAIYHLCERPSLERIHLSYCENISVPAVHFMLNRLQRLTHLSLTGVPTFRREDLQSWCRPPPGDFNTHQRQAFCVYSGKGVGDLRRHLNEIGRRDGNTNGAPYTYIPNTGHAHGMQPGQPGQQPLAIAPPAPAHPAPGAPTVAQGPIGQRGMLHPQLLPGAQPVPRAHRQGSRRQGHHGGDRPAARHPRHAAPVPGTPQQPPGTPSTLPTGVAQPGQNPPNAPQANRQFNIRTGRGGGGASPTTAAPTQPQPSGSNSGNSWLAHFNSNNNNIPQAQSSSRNHRNAGDNSSIFRMLGVGTGSSRNGGGDTSHVHLMPNNAGGGGRAGMAMPTPFFETGRAYRIIGYDASGRAVYHVWDQLTQQASVMVSGSDLSIGGSGGGHARMPGGFAHASGSDNQDMMDGNDRMQED